MEYNFSGRGSFSQGLYGFLDDQEPDDEDTNMFADHMFGDTIEKKMKK